jgi:hypothetical protein
MGDEDDIRSDSHKQGSGSYHNEYQSFDNNLSRHASNSSKKLAQSFFFS